jgi:hypothetical protein
MDQLGEEIKEWETASLFDLPVVYLYKFVYVVEKVGEETDYILAIFTDANIAINYAKAKNKEYIEYEKELWRELEGDLDNLNYILRVNGHRVIKFILDIDEYNREVILDTRRE